MNSELESKLAKFKQMILEDVEKHRRQLEQSGEQAYQQALDDKRNELTRDAKVFYDKRIEQTEDAVKQTISDATKKKNDEALILRRDILNETVQAIEARAHDFLDSQSYRDLINVKLTALKAELAHEQPLVVMARSVDQTWLKSQLQALGYHGQLSWSELPPKQIGGVVLSFAERHIRYNLTLKQMIDDHIDHIGAKLYTLLEEMED